MLKETPPVPQNEMQRLLSLAALDLDYSELNENFKDLTMLAAKVAGTEISLINLIDSYTQWTVSRHGLDLEQMPREDSACHYTIMGDSQFEVQDLSVDDRFKEKSYVQSPLSLRYYFGVPLTDKQGHQIGALCVLDKKNKSLSPEKTEMLKIIAAQVMNRIHTYQTIRELQAEAKSAKGAANKVAHDIRGPLAGIMGLSNVIAQQGDSNSLTEVLEFIQMIHKSSKSLLELADEILSEEQQKSKLSESEINLNALKYKLQNLYNVQAKNKGISLQIQLTDGDASAPFPKNKLLQITGNLISNAIKFTPAGGTVKVDLGLVENEESQQLRVSISDTGTGISNETLSQIQAGNSSSTDGTCGEKGYGFGLALVKHLVNGLGGSMEVCNVKDAGACFTVQLPLKKQTD